MSVLHVHSPGFKSSFPQMCLLDLALTPYITAATQVWPNVLLVEALAQNSWLDEVGVASLD